MEIVNTIIGAVNAVGIVVVIFRVGKFAGIVETSLTNHTERIKRIEDRCEERCLTS